jgi:8-oxo-dGTP diphosphatase
VGRNIRDVMGRRKDNMSEENEKNYIEIGVAIIRKGNHFLVAKRPKGKAFEGKWEFPGGKLELSELPETCIVREIQEEFGISVVVQKSFKIWDFEFPFVLLIIIK